jgi:hypothetical protein
MTITVTCLIRTAGLNSGDDRVHFELKAVDGAFDWTPFLAKKEHNRELLALAIAAVASNKRVLIQTETISPWSEVWWFDLLA